MVIWVLGRSSSGKTRLVTELVPWLRENGAWVHIDGDEFRKIVGTFSSYHSLDQRLIVQQQLQRFSVHLETQGLNVICSTLGIFPDILKNNRVIYKEYFEIFIDTPFQVAAKRDNKGLYKKAMNGELKNFAGWDLPYIQPANSDFVLNNDDGTLFSHIVLQTKEFLSKLI